MNTILFPCGFMPVLAGRLVGVLSYEGIFLMSVAMGVFGFLIATRLKDVYYEEETA